MDVDRRRARARSQQLGRLRRRRRARSDRKFRPPDASVGAPASSSSSSAAGVAPALPQISSRRLGGEAATGTSASTVPREGGSKDSGVRRKAALEHLRRPAGARHRGRRAEHDGDQPPVAAARRGDDVESGGADEAGLHAVGARIGVDQPVGVAHDALAEPDRADVPVGVVFREFADQRRAPGSRGRGPR